MKNIFTSAQNRFLSNAIILHSNLILKYYNILSEDRRDDMGKLPPSQFTPTFLYYSTYNSNHRRSLIIIIENNILTYFALSFGRRGAVYDF